MRAVLTYHSIDDSGSPISVGPDAFERHIRWLVSGKVQVTTLADLAAYPADAQAVALTFDDAFENFETHAAPLLTAHGLPSTVFVVTDHVGRTNAWNGQPGAGIPTLPLLDWAALERLVTAGITLGAHTRTHRPLTHLDGAAIEDEIGGSAECLRRRFGVAPQAFAYPYGAVTQAASDKVSETFSWGCTTDHRPFGESERPALIPRLDMYYYRAPGRLEAWQTPAFKRHLMVTQQRRRLRSLLHLARSGRT
ncbi:MAG: polysaccharide deacetylase family protein [Acidobacteriota bacterium]